MILIKNINVIGPRVINKNLYNEGVHPPKIMCSEATMDILRQGEQYALIGSKKKPEQTGEDYKLQVKQELQTEKKLGLNVKVMWYDSPAETNNGMPPFQVKKTVLEKLKAIDNTRQWVTTDVQPLTCENGKWICSITQKKNGPLNYEGNIKTLKNAALSSFHMKTQCDLFKSKKDLALIRRWCLYKDNTPYYIIRIVYKE